jgi:hypothetical protein
VLTVRSPSAAAFRAGHRLRGRQSRRHTPDPDPTDPCATAGQASPGDVPDCLFHRNVINVEDRDSSARLFASPPPVQALIDVGYVWRVTQDSLVKRMYDRGVESVMLR